MIKEKCPAWGKRCSKCNRRNHFAVKCRTYSVHSTIDSKHNDHSDSSEPEFISSVDTVTDTVHAVNNQGQIHAEMLLAWFTISETSSRLWSISEPATSQICYW